MWEYSVILVVVTFVLCFIKENFFRGNLPPGPYRFPLVGTIPQVTRAHPTLPWFAFMKMQKQYGEIFSIKLGLTNAVVLNSIKVIKDTLNRDEWSGRMMSRWVKERSFHQELGVLFAHEQENWKTQRRFLLRALRDFGFGKKSMLAVIEDELMDITSEMKVQIKSNNGILHMDSYFNLSVLNVLWSMLVGLRYKHDEPTLLRTLKVFNDLIKSGSFAGSILIAYPFLKDIFPDATGMTTQRKGYVAIQSLCRDIIEDRKVAGVYETDPQNVIDIYLQEIGKKSNPFFTEDNLIINMMDLFMAGSETTSNTISWAILFMLLHPDKQEKVQQEIDRVATECREIPTITQEKLMPYVQATILEVHRLGSVLPNPPCRMLLEDSYYNGYLIPKDTWVIANMTSIFLDKEHWGDPEVFRPERFLDSDGKFVPDDWILPFGYGKRFCLGERLASTSLFTYFTTLLYHFSFCQVPDEPKPTTDPEVGFTVAPKPFNALVKVRNE